MFVSRSMTVICGANSQSFEFPPIKQSGHHHHHPTIAFTCLAGGAFVCVGRNLGLVATPDDSTAVKGGETVYIPLPEGAGINHFACVSADQHPAVLTVSVGRA